MSGRGLLSYGLIAAGVTSAAIGVYLACAPEQPAHRAALVVADGERDAGALPPGQHEFTFRVTNTGNVAGKILGFNTACTNKVCYGTNHTEPITVEPGQTVEYTCHVIAYEPGSWEAHMELFVSDDGFRKVALIVRGVCVAPEKKTNVPLRKT